MHEPVAVLARSDKQVARLNYSHGSLNASCIELNTFAAGKEEQKTEFLSTFVNRYRSTIALARLDQFAQSPSPLKHNPILAKTRSR